MSITGGNGGIEPFSFIVLKSPLDAETDDEGLSIGLMLNALHNAMYILPRQLLAHVGCHYLLSRTAVTRNHQRFRIHGRAPPVITPSYPVLRGL